MVVKSIYLIKGTGGETYNIFSNRILEACQSIAQKVKPHSLKVNLTTQSPPRGSVIPFKRKKIAAISVVQDSNEKIGSLLKLKGYSGVYTVDEALPVKYDKTWEDGEGTPGICLLTLFRQRKDIDYDTFIDRWHNSHTPLSLKIHPLWNYNRNVVLEGSKENNKHWDGIVEEQFKTQAELLNPIKFFGNPLVMFYHMWQVYWDTNSFLDYKSIEPYFATEIHIKSRTA